MADPAKNVETEADIVARLGSGGVESWECTSEEYHASPGISNSMTRLFHEDPALYRQVYIEGSAKLPESTPSQKWGTDLEAFIFGTAEAPLIIPEDVLNAQGHRKGSAWLNWKADHSSRELLTAAEYADKFGAFERAAEELVRHETASLYISAGEKHKCIRWVDEPTGRLRRCQLDIFHADYLADLKSSATITPEGFAAAAWRFSYHWQQANYQEAASRLLGTAPPPFVFVVVKNKPSYSWETFELGADFECGVDDSRAAFDRLCRAYESGVFETPTHNRVIRIAAPRWSRYAHEYDFGG
jgi:hypothetical protein